ncbi:MAG: DNA polymerase III subunit beta [Deltaproteobacteria bacterium]|jgi:DNA polymerase-3 subunit beta|nr:DNA polymerase III subunit beta [Deltaproteobacteria bacterium]
MLQFRIKRDDLQKGLNQAGTVAEKRTSIMILNNIHIAAADGEMTLTATDLETTFKGRFPAEVIEPGTLTVPFKTFRDLIRSCSGDVVLLKESDNYSVELDCGSFNTSLFGLSPENYPKTPEIEDVNFIELESRDIIDAINKTLFSVSAGEDTYNLAGIYLIKEEEDDETRFRLVSTDAQRLNVSTIPIRSQEPFELESGIIVPRKGMQELRNLAETVDRISLGLSSVSGLAAKTDTAFLVVRLLEGSFPDYKTILPTSNDKLVYVQRKEMLDALKRIVIMTDAGYRVAIFTFTEDLLTIGSTNPNLGKAEEKLRVEYQGPDITSVGFNPLHFVEALSNMRSDRITIQLKEGKVPYLFTGPEDPGYFGIIMSMTVNQ